MRYLVAIALLFSFVLSKGQDGYFVTFTDKNNSAYSIDKPGEFLSQRAIQRRARQQINITADDLPVNANYVDSLRKAGIDVRHTSKWFNAAIVFSANSNLMDTLDRVSFIASVERNKPQYSTRAVEKTEPLSSLLKSAASNAYGEAWTQISTVNGHLLHQQGYTGQGMHIAVIDAGFYHVNTLPVFQHLWDNDQILGTKDFVNPSADIFASHYHGMSVLSIIGGKDNDDYTGTAPDASFWLLRSEDAYSEHPIEPDYWICAAEFADSAGVDIITTSLGYSQFDPPSVSYTYADMNGTNTRISRASDMASERGMLIITSAGNEGNDSWHYIAAPGDAKQCLTIGAIRADSTKAGFSSFGPSYDGRTKPEVSALGVSVAVQNSAGTISKGNGTSYSTPVVSGLAACLWQALPDKSANEIRQLIIDSANQSDHPDDGIGYGIPDFKRAIQVSVPGTKSDENIWKVSPNPFSNILRLSNASEHNINVSIVDLVGNLKYRKSFKGVKQVSINEIAHFARGIYIITIENKHFKQHVKVIKSH
ncbi:MAG: S8 family serine peptidase [Carboxylicivirga sp.]|jgi:subtilisin family serine protease|nr:S8 family serine peptidase [Carboxylicivirga sp.]